MDSKILRFFTLQRCLFGICPCCGQFFRLSDCRIYRSTKPAGDWMDGLDEETRRLDLAEDKLEEKRKMLQEKAQEKGRREANRIVRKIDHIFTPRKLNPDDAKVVFHPIDYMVFNGMKSPDKSRSVKNIVCLDRELKSSENRQLQKSIERTIEKELYEWVTLRVTQDGRVIHES